jgi:peptide deformylase
MSKIIIAPNPVLRQPTKPVVKVDKKLVDLITDMKHTLMAAKDPQGVGLAAPQVGISLRLFLTRPDLRHKPRAFINPEVVKYSQRQQQPQSKAGVYEGCLSIPDHYSPLRRSMSVTIRYQTLSELPKNHPAGQLPELIEKTETFTGFAAHIIQHEVDHLNGILFIDHVLEQNAPLYDTSGDKWVEIQL